MNEHDIIQFTLRALEHFQKTLKCDFSYKTLIDSLAAIEPVIAANTPVGGMPVRFKTERIGNRVRIQVIGGVHYVSTEYLTVLIREAKGLTKLWS